jgi:hypothetical protein
MNSYAFVAMPFAPEYLPVYTELIVPPFRAAGWRIDRVDEEAHLELITKRVIEKILEADLIVAVLTSYNRNVMYELGVSHAFRKPTLILAASLNDLPFDLAQLRCLKYGDAVDSVDPQLVRNQIKSVIEEFSATTLNYGNPVTSLVPDPFAFIFPLDPFDTLNLQREMIVEKGSRLRHSGKRIKEIDERTVELTSEEGGLFGTFRTWQRSLVLAFVAALLVRDLHENASIISSEMPELLITSREFLEKSRNVAPYNRNLYQLKSIIREIRETLIAIYGDQKNSAHRIQEAFRRLNSGSLRVFSKLVSRFVSIELFTFLFEGAWRDYDVRAGEFPALCEKAQALAQMLEGEIRELTLLEEETVRRIQQ